MMNCGTAQGFALGPPVTAALLPGLIEGVEERLSAVLGTPWLRPTRPVV